MARISRADVFSPDEVAIVHVMNRTVRRCFLMGEDPVSGKNFDHRKKWMENELKRLAACFGIDLLTFAIMSNHFHLILRSRPDVVATWSDQEVARRWLLLCPLRKDADGQAEEPNEFEINSIANDPQKLAEIRSRLSDISWWMRLLSQTIAQRANRDDGEVGKFWQARYKAVRLLDEAAVLACSAYVDLNPIRAAMAETLEASDYTSVQRRVAALQSQASDNRREADTKQQSRRSRPDAFLAPLSIDELRDAIGPRASKSTHRASDKGYLAMTEAGYVELLDYTARSIASGKAGATPKSAAPVFKRLGIDAGTWCELVRDFGRLFYTVAGLPSEIDTRRTRSGTHRHRASSKARELLTAAG